ncbi:MAG: TerB family tellurite resistance protein [Myxococcales bacterium]|nr:TerB family tellurite resistance protein [Myxococcales bacterium]
MHSENAAILKSLVSVAWADGDYGAQEREMVDALLVAFDATEEQAKDIRAYAETKRTLEDVPIEELSADDLRVLIQHAVLLTFIDGTQDDKERTFVVELARYVGIPEAESKELIAAAEQRAKRNLRLL